MSFEEHLKQQAALHPAMTPQDAIKLCYQAAFGAEHLVADEHAAGAMLQAEYDRVPAREGPLWERISEEYARVNLSAWKHRGMPVEVLLQLFLRTAAQPARDGEGTMRTCLQAVGACAAQGELPFDEAAWQETLQAYHAAGGCPVHHSEHYRLLEQPAYRVVRADLLPHLPEA